MNIHFLSFGTTWNYNGALQRVGKQVSEWKTSQDTSVFKTVSICTEQTLVKQFPDFIQTHLNFFQTHPRGFGYWLWKSFLIQQCLNAIPKDHVLFYMDAGCQLNLQASKRFCEYYSLAMDAGLLCFQVGMPEYEWCKGDTADLIVQNDQEIMSQSQIVGGIHMIKNTEFNQQLVAEWQRIACLDGYRYLTDSPSIVVNHSNFKEHRHDQAIFSLLVKKHNQYHALSDETWKPNWHVDGLDYPIWATRNHSINLI
jgi:hypothetical protein